VSFVSITHPPSFFAFPPSCTLLFSLAHSFPWRLCWLSGLSLLHGSFMARLCGRALRVLVSVISDSTGANSQQGCLFSLEFDGPSSDDFSYLMPYGVYPVTPLGVPNKQTNKHTHTHTHDTHTHTPTHPTRARTIQSCIIDTNHD